MLRGRLRKKRTHLPGEKITVYLLLENTLLESTLLEKTLLEDLLLEGLLPENTLLL